jgi:hypothetical protein
MLRLLIVLLLILPSFSFAVTPYGGIGYVNYLNSGENQNTSSFIAGLETGKEKFPWVFTFSFVNDYIRFVGEDNHIGSHFIATAGKQLNHKFKNGFKIYGEFGLVGVTRETIATSSHYNFYESLGFGYKRLRLWIRHISNASLKGRNVGENILYIGYLFNK